MRHRLAIAIGAASALALGAIIGAAPPQDRPGIVGRADVWIRNEGRNQAVPVSIQEWTAGDRPVTVRIAGVPEVHARMLEQQWAYRTITVAAGADIAAALFEAGAQGWEAVGIQPAAQNATLVLLKHPRGVN
jgi:hypothetical protein